MRTFIRGLDTDTASDYELQREFEEQTASLAYDLKVCGPGYPSPRYDSIRAIVAEQERRKAARR